MDGSIKQYQYAPPTHETNKRTSAAISNLALQPAKGSKCEVPWCRPNSNIINRVRCSAHVGPNCSCTANTESCSRFSIYTYWCLFVDTFESSWANVWSERYDLTCVVRQPLTVTSKRFGRWRHPRLIKSFLPLLFVHLQRAGIYLTFRSIFYTCDDFIIHIVYCFVWTYRSFRHIEFILKKNTKNIHTILRRDFIVLKKIYIYIFYYLT